MCLLTDVLYVVIKITKILAIAKAVQLEAARRRAIVLGCSVFMAKIFVLPMRTNCSGFLLLCRINFP